MDAWSSGKADREAQPTQLNGGVRGLGRDALSGAHLMRGPCGLLLGPMAQWRCLFQHPGAPATAAATPESHGLPIIPPSRHRAWSSCPSCLVAWGLFACP